MVRSISDVGSVGTLCRSVRLFHGIWRGAAGFAYRIVVVFALGGRMERIMDRQEVTFIADDREAKEIDRISIHEIGIPSMVLMERASMSVAACIMEQSNPGSDRILAVCGTGNNGGDGVAAARMLWEAGYFVSILIVGQMEKCSDEMRQQVTIAERIGVPVMAAESKEPTTVVTEEKLQKYTIVIDAIFGIGLSREIQGCYREWIAWMNRSAVRIVAVDIPSGIHTGTGEVLGIAVQADQTITFGINKRGLVLHPGTQYAGEIVVADIGFPKQAVVQVSPKAYTYESRYLPMLMPKRKARSHKGTYGTVLVIAGSPQMSGACYFASAAAYRVGVGLVHILTAQENAAILRTKLPEAIVSTWSEEFLDAEKEDIRQMIASASTVVIGPGLGRSQAAQRLLEWVLEDTGCEPERVVVPEETSAGHLEGDSENLSEEHPGWNFRNLSEDSDILKQKSHFLLDKIPVVIDADGINLLAGMKQYFTKDGKKGRRIKLPEQVILTPHIKEMSRLIRQEVPEIANHMTEMVSERTDGCTIVLKDARTLVSDGKDLYINITGNSALAKGGSGDVLSGMIGGLLAQGMEPMKAASLAVFLHGMAADSYVCDRGTASMLASDLLEEIPKVMGTSF